MADYISIGETSPTSPPEGMTEVEFLSEAMRFYDFDLACDKIDRDEAMDDNCFANASDIGTEQWDPIALAMRRIKGAERPVQQWNRIPTYVQQVVNDGRQNKPAIKITAADGGTKETAEFFQDRIRHIEYESNADTATDTARDQQVVSGRGNVRVDTEYIPGTFRQRICILPIENQFSVVWDAAARLYDRSDATRCFIISRISREQHIQDFGKESIVSQTDFARWDNPAPTWIGIGDKGNLIQIAEYWRKEFKKRKLCLLGGNEIPVWKDTLTDEQYDTFKLNGQIVDERMDLDAKVIQYIINGAEILKKTIWHGSTIPIVPFWGRIAVVDGIRRTYSLIRNAKDPQRLVNLYVSNIAEQIAQMPKTPYIAAVGSIPAHLEDDWANAANSPKGFLLYNQFSANGVSEFQAPTRVVNEPPIQALSIGLQQAIEGIKAAMGIYDASLGARSNETSGIAIDQRRKSAEVVNFHFPDNEARSRKRIGEILVELIPLIDRPGSKATIRSEDGKTQSVPIGVPFQDPKTGATLTHILTDGDYGVNVSTGPSQESRRQAGYERDVDLIKANPELMWSIGPQMLRSDDSPGAEERADALERYINIKFPGLIPPKETGKQIPPEVQQKMMAMQKELETKDAFAKSLHDQIQTKQAELAAAQQLKTMEIQAEGANSQAELAMKKYITDEQEKTKRELGLAQIDQKDAITLLTEQLGVLKLQHQMLHDRVTQSADHEHAMATKEGDRAHESEQLGRSHEHETEQQKAAREHEAEQSSVAREHQSAESDADRQAAADAAEQTEPRGAE